ncbi:helix-turn-helix domain-containing protein [Isobaculum melis]|uniref:Helix-turn-helix domain-containing protein n=1 Tax=Isobaculum melis TaxID=142588 RepID=A0A1H9TH13_9LACT|nr:helix-turn-helix transcriptional regulator [Isobaculum melis]SER95903.1 Helix-turn-helix domain-containing protein [Isobaculum melis]
MFAERLKKLRVEQGLSQEELAEILNVSRQSISKYEQGLSFPDYEKLTMLVEYFHISFDDLLAQGSEAGHQMSKANQVVPTSFKILIKSELTRNLTSYYKFYIAKTFKEKKGVVPQAMLMGIDSTSSFWGDSGKPLGWYETVEDAEKEMTAIYHAISQNQPTYMLKYSVKVKRKGFLGLQIDRG